jgi:hypothetical protein
MAKKNELENSQLGSGDNQSSDAERVLSADEKLKVFEVFERFPGVETLYVNGDGEIWFIETKGKMIKVSRKEFIND